MKYTSYYRIPISVALWRSLVNAILRLISKYSFDASSSLAENNAISFCSAIKSFLATEELDILSMYCDQPPSLNTLTNAKMTYYGVLFLVGSWLTLSHSGLGWLKISKS